jgi:hypothetical protein
MVHWHCWPVRFRSYRLIDPNNGFNRIEGPSHMKPMLRSQAFRVVLFLSALASSSLVIEAGQRWR